MNYRSVADMTRCIMGNLAGIPGDVDLVVAVPRSGIMPASMIALARNLPLTDVDGLLTGRLFTGGRRQQADAAPRDFSRMRRILVVDDSVCSGRQLAEVRDALADSTLPPVEYLSVYVDPKAVSLVDHALEVCPAPRIFEWNYLHHTVLNDSCMDIDGVLCRDPRPEENDDGAAYEHFLRTAEPYLLPTVPVRYLVTCRLEKYRALTEQWLASHHIRYGELVMLDLPDMQARRRAGAYGQYKADVYRSSCTSLFIESDPGQATAIAQLAAKPVLCAGTGQWVEPTLSAIATGARDRVQRAVMRRVKRHLAPAVRSLQGFASCRTEPGGWKPARPIKD